MRLFQRKDKSQAVQSLLLKIVNNNCSRLDELREGPRLEQRVRLSVVVLIVPLVEKQPDMAKAFAAVTKEFSTNGLAAVLQEPKGLDEVFVGFRCENELVWARAVAKHLSPMGGGFFQLGFRLAEVVHVSDYPELQALSL
jgi:hypothetical protein